LILDAKNPNTLILKNKHALVMRFMHIGLFSPCSPGHLYPISALGKELTLRGYHVSYIGVPDAKQTIEGAKINFIEYASEECPLGAVPSFIELQGKLTGFKAAILTMEAFRGSAQLTFKYLPDIFKSEKINFCIIDQCSVEAEVVSNFLKIPYVTVCNALNINQDPWVPPVGFSWKFKEGFLYTIRNAIGYKLFNLLGLRFQQDIEKQCNIWNIQSLYTTRDFGSKLAQISQQPEGFDFPRSYVQKYFHFAGPFLNSAARKEIPFPYELLSGKPIIYASMGTVQNRLQWLFEYIAEACHGLNAQLIISKGGSSNSINLLDLPGKPIVVDYAPQYEILKKSTLTITHAGMNTTLESLSAGVPMVAIPITNDQPGIASRIDWTGTGIMVPLKKATIKNLRTAIKNVLTEPSFKERAEHFKKIIEERNGLKLAADLIEDVIKKQTPVT
jgi:zeaxanthin glucosyltransferase